MEKKEGQERVFRLIGSENEKIDFEEIENLIKYLKEKGWKFIFSRNKNNDGWFIDFRKK